jgi:formylglycine-generating enzyme required for sulfatase activity
MAEYDLFLSYNSADRDVVIQVLDQLRGLPEPIKAFFDRENLSLGKLWFDELQTALSNSRAVAIFFGKGGLGRWQKLELILALDQQASSDSTGRDFRVIPVILPGADLNKVPRFLLLNTFADLRSVGSHETLHALARTILAQKNPLDVGGQLNALPSKSEFRNPYRGLNYFREEDAPLFFGRNAVSEKLLNKIKSCPFVALVGNSGSGKSSVVRAGLVPMLRREHSPAPTWEVIICSPAKDHQSPFHNLANAFLASWEYAPDEAVNARPQLETTIRATLSITDCIEQSLKCARNAEKLLLVIDQFEELVTSKEYKADFILFAELLLNTTKTGQCTVLLTIRGDYYGSVIRPHQGLADAIAEGVVNLAQMEQEQLWEVINKPAVVGGAKLEAGLANLVMKDVEKEPGNLALLEYALSELWNHQINGWLTHDAYNNLVGGLEGAIRKKADETLASRGGSNRGLTLSALIRLVRVSPVDEEGGDTRQRVLLSDFSDAERACLEPFVKARLLITSGPDATSAPRDLEPRATTYRKANGAIIEVAHEALVRYWPTLKAALEEKRDFLSWRQSIRPEFEGWRRLVHRGDSGHRIRDSLLTGRNLKVGRDWLNKMPHEFSKEEQEFVIKSERQVAFKNGLVWTSRVGVAFVLCMGGLFVWAERQGFGPTLAMEAMLTRLGLRAPPPEPKMQVIQRGTFIMGASEDDKNARDDERPAHQVTLKNHFAIGVYEVTFEEYDAYVKSMGLRQPQDSGWGRDRRPVIDANWDDAVNYAKWLSFLTGKSYRLPTEAEWEYASRAQSQTIYPWGNEIGQHGKIWANCAGCSGASVEGRTLPVGSFPPSHFGLHDMFGNVGEWVADCLHKNYAGAPVDGLAWLNADHGDCKQRMIRGGSWNFNPTDLRSTFRSKNYPDFRNHDLGFRLVQDLWSHPVAIK